MYYYKIKHFNCNKNEEGISEGIVTGETFTQAIENIESEYGKDDVFEIRFLAPLIGEGDGFCIELNELFDNFRDYGVNYGERAKENKTPDPLTLMSMAKRGSFEEFKKGE